MALDRGDRARLAALVAVPGPRVQPVDLPSGRRVWLKRQERLSGLLRVQKGDPVAAFRRERDGLKRMAAAGHPVPELLDEGPDHIVLADSGPNLAQLLRDPATSEQTRRTAMAQVGAVMGALHRDGWVHGRPVLRDMCWKDGRLVLIDLERLAHGRGPGAMALDLVILVQGWFSRRGVEDASAGLLDLAIAAYRPLAPAAVWPALRRWALLLRLLRPVLRLGRWLRPGSKEFQAGLWSQEYLRGLARRDV